MKHLLLCIVLSLFANISPVWATESNAAAAGAAAAAAIVDPPDFSSEELAAILAEASGGLPEVATAIEALGPEEQQRVAIAFRAAQMIFTDGTEFVSGHFLGMGSFAVVLNGYRRSTGERIAIKMMEHHSHQAAYIAENELAVYRKVKEVNDQEGRAGHPHIVKFFGGTSRTVTIGQGEKRFTFVCLEYLSEDAFDLLYIDLGAKRPQSLADELRYLSEVARFASHILKALDFHHDAVGSHHDVKPENVLSVVDASRSQRIYKLIDEGLAGDYVAGPCGSVPYLAPFQWLAVDAKCDLWALGMILSRMLCPKFFGILSPLVKCKEPAIFGDEINRALRLVYMSYFQEACSLQSQLGVRVRAVEAEVQAANDVAEATAIRDRHFPEFEALANSVRASLTNAAPHLQMVIDGYLADQDRDLQDWWVEQFGGAGADAIRPFAKLLWDLTRELLVVDPNLRPNIKATAGTYTDRLEELANICAGAGAAAAAAVAGTTNTAAGGGTSDATDGDSRPTTGGSIDDLLPNVATIARQEKNEARDYYLRRHDEREGDVYRRASAKREKPDVARARVEDRSLFFTNNAAVSASMALFAFTCYRAKIRQR